MWSWTPSTAEARWIAHLLINCISWNVCGLGNDQTRNALENISVSHKPNWMAIFEPKILPDQLPRQFLNKINLIIFAINDCLRSRPNIWVLCKPYLAPSAQTIATSDQFVSIKSEDRILIFVHASNIYSRRRILWTNLLGINEPKICIMGDFNVVLGAHERSSGTIGHASSITEFQNFISDKDLFNIEGVGNGFTWATCRNGEYMAARLDRALASQS